MHSTLRKFLTTFTVFFLLLFSTSTPVFADNNDPNTPTCTVIINNVPGSLTSDTAPVAPASDGGDSSIIDTATMTWNVSVSLSQSARTNYENNCGVPPGRPLKVSFYTVDGITIGGWPTFNLTGDGSNYSGVLSYLNTGTDNNDTWQLDVEVENPSGGVCPHEMPVCRRVYVILDGTQIENENQSCTTEIANFKAAVAALSQESLALNNPVSLNVTLPQSLIDACSVSGKSYSLVSNANNQSFASGNLNAGSNSISFTPSLAGRYSLTVNLTRTGQCSSGMGGTGGCDQITIPGSENTTANFCVIAPGQTSCTAAPPTPSGQPEQIGAFSLCRQIPILTDADITRQLENVPAADRVAAEADLKRRAAKQRTEKVACCQCTFGTREIDPNTGACRGEQYSQAANRVRQGFKPGLYTAVGCIGADSDSIVTRLVRIGLGIAGGVALLMILAGSFMFSTSQGDPKKASEAKELITSAVIGLVFIIFSVTLLQFIGVTILHLPGFGSVAQ